EVPAPRRTVGRKADLPQRHLVTLRVRPGGEEQDDLARRRRAGVDQLAHATSDRTRLAVAPGNGRVAVAALVADEKLDRVAEDRVRKVAGRREPLVAGAELGAEEMVDRREHLRPRAVVACQWQLLPGALAAVAEDRDVGVAEAVDRLELVADEEHIGRAADEIDEL